MDVDAVKNLLEPGSVFKPVSFLVAMNDGYIDMDDWVDTGCGIRPMYGRNMKDHNHRSGGYGVLTVPQILQKSSNIGVRVLIDKFYHNQPEKFVDGVYSTGIAEDLHLPIPGYAKPRIRRPLPDGSNWSKTALPWMSIGYETPAKLGADRLAAAVGAAALKPGCELLVIDAGSCMTIDRVTADGLYLGGNISPGLEMRLKAMHALTARLPLVGIDGATPQWGHNTAEALRSGALTGIRGEADSYLRRFFAEQAGGNAYAFLTGGDACRLDTLP